MGLEKISEIRKSIGMTIEELAEKSGVPISTLKKISSGSTANPTLDTMKAIARALGCTIDAFDDIKKAQADKLELDEREARLIIHFRSASQLDQDSIFRFAEYAASAAVLMSSQKTHVQDELETIASLIEDSTHSQQEIREVVSK